MKSLVLLVVFLSVYDWSEGCGRRPLVAPPGNSEPMTWADAEEGAWPWQVSIQLDDDVVCGGTIVHRQWVLTAAYCYSLLSSLQSHRVVAGVTVRSQIDHSQTRSITKLRKHPGYDSSTSEDDVMLVRLDSPLDFTDYVQPICLAYVEQNFTHCFVSGWKRFNAEGAYMVTVLQNLVIATVDPFTCSGHQMIGNMICGITLLNESSQSDLGGPLQCYNPKYLRFYQVGVSSAGPWYGKDDGVYTTFNTFSMWIDDMVALDETLQPICAGSKSSFSLVLVLLSAVLLLLHVWE